MDRMVDEDTTHFNVDHIADETLIAESGKLVFLVELLDNLKSEGHRCLVFSQSRKVLNIIQKIMRNRVSDWLFFNFHNNKPHTHTSFLTAYSSWKESQGSSREA